MKAAATQHSAELLAEFEQVWPKKGDRLLKSSDNWKRSSSFCPHRLTRDVFIWDGYMRAGAALIDEAERKPRDRDVLVYPILFNYRHGLESAMKWIIERYGEPAGVLDEKQDHGLWDLWKLCKQILVEPSDNDESLQAVERIVKDIHDLDKNAQAFRYSKTKDGAMILLPDTRVDLGNMRRVMEAVDNFFQAADGLLDSLGAR